MKKIIKKTKALTKEPKAKTESSNQKKLTVHPPTLPEVLFSPLVNELKETLGVSEEELIKLTAAMLHLMKIDPPQQLSLLPDNSNGWELVERLENLFILYRHGDHYLALLSEKLRAIESRFCKGNDLKGLEKVNGMQRAVFLLMIRSRTGELNKHFEAMLIKDLTDSIGATMGEAWFCNSPIDTRNKADELCNLYSRSIKGMVRLKNPSNAKHARKEVPMERTAIEYARVLCGKLRRLPTKSELRYLMEKNGFGYSNERSRARSKYTDLFERSGLEALKE